MAGIPIVHMLKGTDYFAVCVDNDQELLSLQALADIDDVELDPTRAPKYLPESERIVHRHLQEEDIPYGVNLVKAPEFWSTYNKKGSGVKVCVVDTGLLGTHEDLKDADVDGSSSTDLVIPYSQDGHGHGTHVSGTIGATENGKGVVGVAPEVSIFVARGT
jgi:subtilisin family serine protease